MSIPRFLFFLTALLLSNGSFAENSVSAGAVIEKSDDGKSLNREYDVLSDEYKEAVKNSSYSDTQEFRKKIASSSATANLVCVEHSYEQGMALQFHATAHFLKGENMHAIAVVKQDTSKQKQERDALQGLLVNALLIRKNPDSTNIQFKALAKSKSLLERDLGSDKTGEVTYTDIYKSKKNPTDLYDVRVTQIQGKALLQIVHMKDSNSWGGKIDFISFIYCR